MKLRLSGYISAPSLESDASLQELKDAGLLNEFVDDVAYRDPANLFIDIDEFPDEISQDDDFLEYLVEYTANRIKNEDVKFVESDFEFYEEYPSFGWDYNVLTDIDVEKIYKKWKNKE